MTFIIINEIKNLFELIDGLEMTHILKDPSFCIEKLYFHLLIYLILKSFFERLQSFVLFAYIEESVPSVEPAFSYFRRIHIL